MYIYKLPNAAASKISVTSTATGVLDLIDTAASTEADLPSTLNSIDITPEDGDIRMMWDGNSPTSSDGFLLKSGQTYSFRNIPALSKMELIRTGASNVNVSVQVGSSSDSESTSIAGAPSLAGGGTVDGDLEITGDLNVDGDFNFGDASTDSITSQGAIIIGADLDEAFVVQDDGGANKYLVVDTVNGQVDLFGNRLNLNTNQDTYLEANDDNELSITADGFEAIKFDSSNHLIFSGSLIRFNNTARFESQIRINTGVEQWFGTGLNYNFSYSPSGNFQLTSADIDGGGTDGMIWQVPDGPQHLEMVNGNLRMLNGTQIHLGDGNDYRLFYNAASTEFRFVSNDIDGGGTNGTVFQVSDGTADFEIPNGNLIVDTDTLYVDSANNEVGIGTTSPDYDLEVAGTQPVIFVNDAGNSNGVRLEDDGLWQHYLNDVLTLGGTSSISLKTYDNGWNEALNVATTPVSTSDATTTTAKTFSIPNNQARVIKARVVAVNTDDYSQVAGYEIMWTVKNDGGTLTEVGETRIAEHEDASGLDVDGNISGTDFQVQVTGLAGTNIDWKVTTEQFAVA